MWDNRLWKHELDFEGCESGKSNSWRLAQAPSGVSFRRVVQGKRIVGSTGMW